QADATPERVAAEAAAYLDDPARSAGTRARLARGLEDLGPPGAPRRTADALVAGPAAAAPPPVPAAPVRGSRRRPRHAGRRLVHGPRDVSFRPALRSGPHARSADRRDGPCRRRARPRIRGRREVRREADGGREGARRGARIAR